MINSISLKFKQQITGKTGNNGTKDVKIMLTLKYLSMFWRTLEITLINCEVSLMSTWSKSLPLRHWYCSKSSVNNTKQ